MTGLAPDPAVPRRDALLAHGGKRLHVKYRFGESLRVTYRCDEGIFAVRSFPPGTSDERFRRARAAGADVAHLPEAHAVRWRFPHDRKLTALPRLADPPSLLPACVSARLVAYAAERSATAECRDGAGALLAYAKLAGAGEAGLTRRIAAAVGAHHPHLRVPRVLAADGEVLALEALTGRRLDALGPAALEPLGAALAALHALPRPAPARFTRLDPERLATAAGVVARARPDVAGRVTRLFGRLERSEESRPAVCLHGDANLRNAILLGDGRVGLIDLEHVSAGPAAADLGQLLAGLLGRADRRAAGAALLAGYARVAPPPDRAALRWHTAASVLARVALPAVGRVRTATLARLPELLDAAAGLVARHPAEVAL